MVVLTAAYVEKECARTQSIKSLTRGIDDDHLDRMTHLRMNDKFVREIGDFSICRNLKFIYLRNNRISKIINLDFATNVTHLYLEHNELTKIENLDRLENLTILCLGYNRINVVEGLTKLEKLSELRIERQRLCAGNCLIFDPRTADALSHRLKVLNVTGNGLSSLQPLRNFTKLEILVAKENRIDDIEDLTECIGGLRKLRELFLSGNPVHREYGYRENLIASSSDSLEKLDGKQISDVCRRFIKSFQVEKQQRIHREPMKKTTLSDDITTSLNLPPAFERSVSRAIIQQHQQQQQQQMQQYPGPRFTLNGMISSAGAATAAGSVAPLQFPAWKSASAIAKSNVGSALRRRKSIAVSSRNSTRIIFTNVLPPIQNQTFSPNSK